jgi:hypothetical protein
MKGFGGFCLSLWEEDPLAVLHSMPGIPKTLNWDEMNI